MDFIKKTELKLVRRMRRKATAWAFGSHARYELSNRFGNGSRPGRESYAIVMAHDPAAIEPTLDHSEAHTTFYARVARIHGNSRAIRLNPLFRFFRTSRKLKFNRVKK